MPLIKDETQYNIDTNLSDRDTVIGSDHDSGGKTKNFKLLDIANYISSKIDTGVDLIGSRIINGNKLNTPGTYDYFVWTDDYLINSQRYTTYISNTVSLASSDNLLDRIDAVVVNSNGTIGVLTGTPSETASIPSIDYETQVLFFFVLVKANSTSPEGVVTTTIYDEDTGLAGGEFVADYVTPNIVTNNTDEYHSGTKSIYFNGDGALIFTNDVKIGNSKLFNIILRVKLSNIEDHKILIAIGESISNNPSIPGGAQSSDRVTDIAPIEDGKFGFDKTKTSDWQTIIIPFSAFQNSLPFDKVWIVNQNSDSRFYIDNIIVQDGIALTSSDRIIRTSQLINDGPDGTNPFLKTGDSKVKIDGFWFDTTENTDKNAIEVGNEFEGWDGDYYIVGIVKDLPFNVNDSSKVKKAIRNKAI